MSVYPSLAAREVIPIPSFLTSEFVKADRTGIYLNIVLLTLVVYDARKCALQCYLTGLSNSRVVLTFDKEV